MESLRKTALGKFKNLSTVMTRISKATLTTHVLEPLLLEKWVRTSPFRSVWIPAEPLYQTHPTSHIRVKAYFSLACQQTRGERSRPVGRPCPHTHPGAQVLPVIIPPSPTVLFSRKQSSRGPATSASSSWEGGKEEAVMHIQDVKAEAQKGRTVHVLTSLWPILICGHDQLQGKLGNVVHTQLSDRELRNLSFFTS